MKPKCEIQRCHAIGELERVPLEGKREVVLVDTYGGCVHVERDPQAAVTGMGQLPLFHQLLQDGLSSNRGSRMVVAKQKGPWWPRKRIMVARPH